MVNPANCYRLFADADGESYFEEIQFPMASVQFAPPAPALHVSNPVNAEQFVWLRFPADWTDAAHPSPRRQLFIILTGEIEGWTSKGDTRRFGPGDCLLMEDTTGKGHGARPLNGEVTAIMIALD